MASSFNYPVFQRWYNATNWIMDRCDRMPKQTRFTVSGRIVQLTLEIQELLIEAIYNKEKRAVLLQSVNLDLEKLRLFFRLCRDRKYISPQQHQYISKEIDDVGKMVGGWLKDQGK